MQLILICQNLASVKFAQVSDPHIFEDAKRAEDAKISAADFLVVVEKINNMSKESKVPLSFIVLTGDLGIGKLIKPKEVGTLHLIKDVDKWDQAKVTLAQILKVSTVKKWLIVPGNNDLFEENPESVKFYEDFLKEVQEMPEIKAAGLSIVDFRLEAPRSAQPKSPPGVYVIKDYVFVGWDNAFFKNNDSVKPFMTKDHKVVPFAKTLEYKSVQKLSRALQSSKAKYAYIFYHIPEIDDPYMIKLNENEKGNVVSKRMDEAKSLSLEFAKGIYPYSAWTVPLEVRQLWEKVATNQAFRTPVIKGLFAGHFHDHKKNTYETTTWVKDTRYKSDILKKLYLDPPISIKYQEKKPPTDRARGAQIVTIDDQGNVSREIFWLD
jgi:hypothetical protein